MESFESMRLIGWDDDLWRVDRMKPIDQVTHEDVDLLDNMAGNAFSLWHYRPWVIATLATLGKFAQAEDSMEAAAKDELMSVRSSDSDSNPFL